ncbi:MAG: methyl-accepting chemotaxis protein [Moorella sp. (in: firmicutes)]|uniref:Methyl-accepting chemotaxis protein McpC n=1 Tax=Neomoorella thermoacetica TaxID=1525 RepID=A0A1J5NID1_NEOTH|nr:methyl-accepting chemotaxis protein [Moorella sp. (in: firmicutes)]OIQ58602.1 methyl-accepting chemotaxis protein McpC [Moorella thermoacetica]
MKRLGLQWQILLMFTPIICLALFATSFFTYYQARQALRQATARQLMDAAREATEKISLIISSISSQQFASKVNYLMVNQKNGFNQQGLPVDIYILDNQGEVHFAAAADGGQEPGLPQAVRQQVVRAREGWERQYWEGHNHALAFAQITEKEWVYLIVADEAAYLAPVNSIRRWSQAAGLAAILLTTLAALFIARQLARPLRHFRQIMAQVESGDLAARVVPGGSAETVTLALGFNSMLEHLGGLITIIKKASISLAGAQGELQAVVERARAGTDRVAGAIAEVAAGAEEQAAATQEAGAGTARVAALVTDMRRHLDAVNATSRSILTAVDMGREQLTQAVAAMDSLADQVRAVAVTVEELGSISGLIENMVVEIKRIAEETNLLALNAAIEAARAGEQGRGFAVVAAKVRELAASSAATADQVAVMVTRVQEGTARALAAARAGNSSADDGRERVRTMAASLTDLLQAVRQTQGEIQEVFASTGGITKAMEEIVTITGVLGETAAGAARAAQEVNTLTQDFRQHMDQVATAAATLEVVTRQLTAATAKVRV